ncbi:hypothetical protein CBM2586_B10261 [Cupriavidus phytorum]|uniref:Uncharacterized protein n=1 Tax=Cupriavidus taiwanensis TaxID=164546 RepID=A0A375C9A0_9BURK|nr:hypothetical protein CBM2586_B10261 [Cupriavidus taiwanensis]
MRCARRSIPAGARRYPVMTPAVRQPPRAGRTTMAATHHTHGTGATHEQFHEGHRRTD